MNINEDYKRIYADAGTASHGLGTSYQSSFPGGIFGG
jgi:hypothetical protein